MAYYRGDYYRGDYYRSAGRNRGDFLSTLRSAGSALAAKVGNYLPQSWTPAGAQKAGLAVAGGALAGAAGLAAGPALAAGGRALKLGASVLSAVMPGGAPAGTMWVEGGSRRRMNVTNPKALRKALRRVAGFGKMARRARRDIGRAATAVGVTRGRAKRFGKR